MNSVLFEERQTLCWRYLAIAAGLTLLALYFVKTNPATSALDAVMVPVTALIGLTAAVGFTQMHTVLTPREIRFGFPMWRKRLPVSKLEVCGIEPMKFYYGIGVHWTGSMWVYNVHMGEGVRVEVNGRSYLIGSREPEQLRHALLELTKERIFA